MTSPYVLKRAVLSEKAYAQMKRGIYTFLIDERAKKADVTKSVEAQFGVKVKTVRVLRFAPKTKRILRTRKTASSGGGKKALVTLVSGESIALLAPKAEKDKKKPKKKMSGKRRNNAA